MAKKVTPENVAALQAQIDANPKLQQALAQWKELLAQGYRNPKTESQRHAVEAAIQQELEAMGANDLHDYTLMPSSGKLERSGFIARNPEWAVPAIFAGGVAGAQGWIPGIPPAGQSAGATGGAMGSAGAGAAGTAGSAASALPGAAKGALGVAAEEGPDWLKAAMASLAGLPALFANKGPSDEERAYQSQAARLLRQQEQRTQYQNPLYEATTKMAYGLLPTMGNNGNPYPLNSLSDVQTPGIDELIAGLRRT